MDSLYIAHHGIKGMKWGVWNTETRKRYTGIGEASNAGGGGGGLEDLLEDDAKKMVWELLRQMGWDTFNMTEIIKNPDMWKMLTEAEDADETMKKINPYHTAGMTEYSLLTMLKKFGLSEDDLSKMQFAKSLTNCASCTVMYDLRRRGFDVDANMTENLAYQYSDHIGRYYKDAKNVECKTIEAANKALQAMPDGARGGFSGTTVNGGGHAIAWEKENGEVVYRDCQSGKKYSPSDIDTLFDVNHDGDPKSKRRLDKNVSYVRLDDKTPNLRDINADGLVSKGGTSGHEDRVEDRVRDVDGYDSIITRLYKNTYDKDIKDDPDYDEYKKMIDDERERVRKMA